MSAREIDALFEGLPGGRRAARRGAAAVRELAEAAREQPLPADYVADLIEAVTDEIRRRRATPPLPEAERAVWKGVGAQFDRTDVVTHVQARRAAAYADLLQRCLVGDAAIADVLGVDRSRVSQRLADHSLYAFQGPDTRYFPRWQLTGKRTLPKLRTVLRALDPHLHPLSVDHWFTTPNVDLEIEDEPATPVEWLATGGDPSVAAELAADL